jgi:hypothetical protein
MNINEANGSLFIMQEAKPLLWGNWWIDTEMCLSCTRYLTQWFVYQGTTLIQGCKYLPKMKVPCKNCWHHKDDIKQDPNWGFTNIMCHDATSKVDTHCNITTYCNAITLQVTDTKRSYNLHFHPVSHGVTVSCKHTLWGCQFVMGAKASWM